MESIRSSEKRFSWFKLVLLLLIAGILCQNVILHLQNVKLEKDVLQAAMREIKPGVVFSELAGIDLQERYVKVDFSKSSNGVVLISFSTGCPGCRENLENWLKLAENLRLTDWKVVWVSRDPFGITKTFCAEAGITDLVLSELSYRQYTALGLGMVPRTMIVNHDGEVQKVWVGKLDGSAWSDLLRHLDSRQHAEVYE